MERERAENKMRTSRETLETEVVGMIWRARERVHLIFCETRASKVRDRTSIETRIGT